ncbi:arginine--tRNA ligase [Candidatus Cerribacteria bacterium 'Amazon FNV 2010 28 9']|uniref:Arginine--tRNA ligase n=1 Tax=Candidatus Cerribacteria bacterium 'Amazon FNV 2010 28 9' TaxID=2081795 RepID=A0A317JNT2_9BACT|nr:MAG: arginine--tRNA ligase [Candidatus Cerribacteria bacterium 'Amazon FNV 2010 28 9']
MIETSMKERIKAFIQKSLEPFIDGQTIEVQVDEQPQFGDYSTNIALQCFKRIKTDTQGIFLHQQAVRESTPQGLAHQMVDIMNSQLPPFLSKVEVAGSGFINFYLSDATLVEQTLAIATDAASTIAQSGKGKKIIVEYSSPNIAKPFTVGHLRSTIIGDALANLFEVQGWEVHRDNHLGDWGTQFGKLIAAIKEWPEDFEKITTAQKPVDVLVNLYIKFHQEAEHDLSLEEKGRAWFKKLEDGDQEARELWQQCINWSWQEFNRIYKELGIDTEKFENNGRGYGESFFEDKMQPVIDELRQKGLLHEGKEGAQIVEFPDEKYPPLMILKKDGATLYATRDLATDKFRLQHYGSDITIVNEVGAEQSLYFKQLFELEYMLRWYKPGQRVHVGHGFFRLKQGKMSTRKGTVIWLEDVIDEAVGRATLFGNHDQQTARKVGIGALKWSDLKRSAHLDVIFDWDEVLNMQGNSGPYIQYTAVRAQSVLDKAGAIQEAKPRAFDESERLLASKLQKFGECINTAASEYAPHYVCTYLYELAQAYNAFYNKDNILDAGEETALRLRLTQATAKTLTLGLEILGIQVPEKM